MVIGLDGIGSNWYPSQVLQTTDPDVDIDQPQSVPQHSEQGSSNGEALALGLCAVGVVGAAVFWNPLPLALCIPAAGSGCADGQEAMCDPEGDPNCYVGERPDAGDGDGDGDIDADADADEAHDADPDVEVFDADNDDGGVDADRDEEIADTDPDPEDSDVPDPCEGNRAPAAPGIIFPTHELPDVSTTDLVVSLEAPIDPDGDRIGGYNITIDSGCDGRDLEANATGWPTTEYELLRDLPFGATVCLDVEAVDAPCGNVSDPTSIEFETRPYAFCEVVGGEVRVTDNVGSSQYPSLTWNSSASEYAISWDDNRDGNPEIYARLISAAGTPLGLDTRVTGDTSDSGLSSLVWTGSEYGICLRDNREGNHEIYFVSLSAAGVPGTEVRITDAIADSTSPSLVWTGSEYGVAWRDRRDGNAEIYFALLSAAGIPGTEARITNDLGNSDAPSLVWTGSEFGVSWNDDRDGNNEIYFGRIDATGSLVPGSIIRLTEDDDQNSLYPSLVWTGTEFGVAWHDQRHGEEEVYFVRVTAAGTRIETDDIRITDSIGDSRWPSLFWNGSEFAIAWHDERHDVGGPNNEIYFARIPCAD